MKLTRKALLGVDGVNPDTSRNIKIEIEIVARLPFISISQVAGKGAVTTSLDVTTDVVYNSAIASGVTEIASLTNVKNVLIGETDATRFNIVGACASISSSGEGILYYDKKYGDYLLIPNLVSLGSDNEVDVLGSNTFVIKGYIVGGKGEAIYDTTKSIMFSVSENDRAFTLKEGLPLSHPVITKTHLLTVSINNVESRSSEHQINLGSVKTTSDRLPTHDFIGIGSTASLTGDTYVYKALMLNTTMTLVLCKNKVAVDQLTFFFPW